MNTILKLENISKIFPGVKALSGINLSVDKGEIHALLGENGAGKSTLMKILSGIYQPDEGQIFVSGKPQQFANYNNAIDAGIGIIFQEFSLIPHLNAVENIFLGRELTNCFGWLLKAAMREKAQKIFDRLGIDIDMSVDICQLSVAHQQFVEIGKALALNAQILILDEPTATLTPIEAQHLFKIMRDLKQAGVAMIFISHHMEEIFEVCDRITVLRDGKHVGCSDIAGTDLDELVEMMVGRKLESNFPPKPASRQSSRVALEAIEVQIKKDGPINSFVLYEGEILGFAGLVGSGRTELARAVIGADAVWHKEIWIDGAAVSLQDPADALKCGIGLLPESRKTEGLIIEFSIKENISINNLGKYLHNGFLIDKKAELGTSEIVVNKVGIKASGPDALVSTLSGGNQQKVVIARWLNHYCKILIFDEPTRGIDIGAKAEIYILMRELTRQGYSIIMISSELPEVVGMCDRVAVFKQGAIVQTLLAESINSNEVMRHATA
ncbi:sugar ABC transporter ATP-binding protein [Glaciimonas immobilis]|uniref:Ribose transport system ATP-binding protein n=1 Tax=Glaciimonas immobilis TaxID=728004 RepID=A0A840S105_9BURK|nr:sugar ABC transporter ATP-binding protein [Glaciimonas immobilis]KAF3996275.1 sugar ABC transporter ATP-binding protein [Glaciimonas immobilis]MBB5202310.1 ribose transport system ATP-binding protein [Glaciimonas immobilis]